MLDSLHNQKPSTSRPPLPYPLSSQMLCRNCPCHCLWSCKNNMKQRRRFYPTLEGKINSSLKCTLMRKSMHTGTKKRNPFWICNLTIKFFKFLRSILQTGMKSMIYENKNPTSIFWILEGGT
ncbi:hypothetical protein AMTRI_Chr13g123220 [Amborella trichopoda]